MSTKLLTANAVISVNVINAAILLMIPFVECLFRPTEAAASISSDLPRFIRPSFVLYPPRLDLIPVSFPLILSIGPTLLIFLAGISADIYTASIEKTTTKIIFNGLTTRVHGISTLFPDSTLEPILLIRKLKCGWRSSITPFTINSPRIIPTGIAIIRSEKTS